MSDTAREQSDATFCADLVRTSDFERYATTLFVDPDQRRALLSLYAFNIEIARVREQISQPLAGEIRLQWWDDLLGGTTHGDAAGNPVAAELLQTIERLRLPHDRLRRMIDAHRFDLYDEPMPTMEDLQNYLYDTASALFGLSAQVLNEGLPVDDTVAYHAGLAIGLTRIVEALPRHAARGQTYLPADRLAHFRVEMNDVAAGKTTAELSELLRQLAIEARVHLDEAMTRLGDLPKLSRKAFLPLATLGRELAAIEDKTYNPFLPPQMSRLRILTMMWFKARAFDRM
jgi:phytoene synthase